MTPTPTVALPNDARLLEVVRRIAAGFDPERIILFGSRARGDADPDSDTDLLVVVRTAGDRRRLAAAMDRATSDVGLARDIIVATPEELARDRDVVGTIAWPALREGRVVYARPA